MAKRLQLLSAQPFTLKHYPSLFCLALVPIQDPELVDGVESRRVIRAHHLLVPGQRPLVHPLRLGQPALLSV